MESDSVDGANGGARGSTGELKRMSASTLPELVRLFMYTEDTMLEAAQEYELMAQRARDVAKRLRGLMELQFPTMDEDS